MHFFEEVYDICSRIPKGKVATYGQIACLLGNPRAARQVGWALRSCPSSHKIACHRVLNRHGKLCEGYAFGNVAIQKQLLEEEGIQVINNTVDLAIYLWKPNL